MANLIEKFQEEFLDVEVERYTPQTIEIRLRRDDGTFVQRMLYVNRDGELVYSGD